MKTVDVKSILEKINERAQQHGAIAVCFETQHAVPATQDFISSFARRIASKWGAKSVHRAVPLAAIPALLAKPEGNSGAKLQIVLPVAAVIGECGPQVFHLQNTNCNVLAE